jgi:hypothetical protein
MAEIANPGGPDGADALLTEGYARALALERCCLRMREEAADLVARVDEPQAAQQLRTLGPALRAAERELSELRSALAELRSCVAVDPPAAGGQMG